MPLAGVEGQTGITRQEYLTMLLWGKPGCGKTVLAATAPGHKVWMQFDPNGTASLASTDNFTKYDFSSYKPLKMGDFKQGGSIERDLITEMRALKDKHGEVTVVVDSVTSYMEKALHYAIQSGKANSGKFVASLETPGMTGWGIRTALIIDMASAVLNACAAVGAHCIFICHEKEETDNEGKVTDVTLALGGQAANALPVKISEIWRISDTGKDRLVWTRNVGVFAPMRSRMFLSNDNARFVWRYDQQKPETQVPANTIAGWYEQWKANSFDKIASPNKG
jgi:hypothetical protein